jgi:hypothetical protein
VVPCEANILLLGCLPKLEIVRPKRSTGIDQNYTPCPFFVLDKSQGAVSLRTRRIWYLYSDGYAVAFVLVDGLEFPTVELKTFKDRVFPIFS